MPKNFKSIYKSLSSIFDNIYNKLSKNDGVIQNKIKSNNMDNNTYGDSLEQQIYVVPGHYRNKYESSMEGDIPKLDVIRVYGPDPKREGFWICDDGKPRTDSNILDNYILMDLAPSESASNDKSHLFKDFEPVEAPKTKKYSEPVQFVSSIPKDTFKNQPEENFEKVFANIDHVDVTKIFQQPQSVEIAIIEKLNIETYNESIIEKYGDESLCKPIKNIPIGFNIPFMYDLENLRKTVKMLNLDEKEIADYLTNQVLSVVDIKMLLNREIVNMLTDINYSLDEPEVSKVPPVQPVVIEQPKEESIQQPKEEPKEEPKVQETPQQKELNEGIENIGKYLTNFF